MIGIHLVVATFVGLFIGHFLDKTFGTSPWLTYIFLFLGIFTGFRDMFTTLKKDVFLPDDKNGPEEPPMGDWDDEEDDDGDRKDNW